MILLWLNTYIGGSFALSFCIRHVFEGSAAMTHGRILKKNVSIAVQKQENSMLQFSNQFGATFVVVIVVIRFIFDLQCVPV